MWRSTEHEIFKARGTLCNLSSVKVIINWQKYVIDIDIIYLRSSLKILHFAYIV